jgi:hypothetical protein
MRKEYCNNIKVQFKTLSLESARASILCGAVLSVLALFPFCANALEAKTKSGVQTVFMYQDAPSLNAILANKTLVGRIHYSYWFWSVYDASLYAKDGKFSWSRDFVLKIKYLRDFSSQSIVEETIKQMRKQQGNKVSKVDLDVWGKSLAKIFPEIKENDQLIGAYDVRGLARFYNGKGKFLGEIRGQLFIRSFFDVWLGNHAQEPDLSRKLRGL